MAQTSITTSMPTLALGRIDASAARASAPGLLAQLWRRKGICGGVFVGVLAIVGIAIAVLPTRYTATGSFIVAGQEPAAVDTSAAWVQKLGDPADLESHLLLIRSPRLLRAVLARPDVPAALLLECQTEASRPGPELLLNYIHPDKSCQQQLATEDAMLDWVTLRYGAATAGRSRVINVSYQSSVASVAQIMTNALITVYLADELQQKVESRSSAVAWLWKEIDQIGSDLRKEDLEIQAYRNAHGLVRGSLAGISSEQLSSLSQQLAVAKAARAEAQARLQEAGDDGTRSNDARAVLDSRSVTELKLQLSLVTQQLANSAQTFGPNHPTIVALQRQRDDIQGRIARETQAVGISAQRAFAAATEQVATLQKQLDALKLDVGSATDAEAAIASMVRNAEIKRELYVELYKRASGMETDRRVLTGNTHLVNLADLPSLPSFPKRAPFAAAGLVLAAILGVAAALLRDRADRSVRAADDIEQLSGIPVLAQLPRAKSGARNMTVALREASQPSMLQETLRGLYAQLMLQRSGTPLRTLLVTSAGSGEGKTFTTIALARFAASSGLRVLLIEGDLRRPSFQNVMQRHPGPGLSDYLAGRAAIENVISASGAAGLDVIHAGEPQMASTEMLSGPRMGELLACTSSYDLVLLDSSPSDALMDARILARQVDGVLYCARWASSKVADVAAGVSALQQAGGNVVGVAVTMVVQGQHALYDPRPLRDRPYLATGIAA
jgi:capsular exopolysaccharide synthesis family protein